MKSVARSTSTGFGAGALAQALYSAITRAKALRMSAATSSDCSEFSNSTKRMLAERAAWRCAHPQCPVATIGPSEANGSNQSITLGEAAHITAAAVRGPRYDRATEQQRRDSVNGVSMGRHHARLVDAEGTTPDTLRMWKRMPNS